MSTYRLIPILIALVSVPALAQPALSQGSGQTQAPEAVTPGAMPPDMGTPAPWPGYGMPMPYPPPAYFGPGMPPATQMPQMPAPPFADQGAGGQAPARSPEGRAAEAPPPGYPPGYPPAHGRASRAMGMRLSQEATEEAYILRIAVGEGQTQGVQVNPLTGPRRQGLAISSTTESQVTQEDTLAGGRGYQRSFGFSRGSMNRRIPVPPDADLAKMTREDLSDTVVITIPRRAPTAPPQN